MPKAGDEFSRVIYTFHVFATYIFAMSFSFHFSIALCMPKAGVFSSNISFPSLLLIFLRYRFLFSFLLCSVCLRLETSFS